MRAFLLVAWMTLAGAAAHADEISYTAAIPPNSYDATAGYGFQVITPGFDSALGTLESVSMTVVGTAEDSLFSGSGDVLPFAAVFSNIGSVSGYGLSEFGVISQDTGTAATLFADTSFSVNATVSTSQDLRDYAANAIVSTFYAFYSTVTNTSTGQELAYDSSTASFTGTVTQTYSYTTAVPEPASLAIFAIGLLAFAGLACRRGAQSMIRPYAISRRINMLDKQRARAGCVAFERFDQIASRSSRR